MNASAFEASYASLRVYALRVAHRACSDWVRADEFADEGMLRLWISWGRIAGRPEPEHRTWLAAIIRNLIISDFRKRPALPPASLDGTCDYLTAPEPPETARDILLPLLRRAWPRLSTRQRAFISASLAYDGQARLTGRILARLLNISYASEKKLSQSTMTVLRNT